MADESIVAPPSGYAIPPSLPWAEAKSRTNYIRRSMLLELSVRLAVRVPGNIVEFGVATGASTRVIRRALRQFGSRWFAPHGRKTIFALDSFEGLQEAFESAAVGTFAGKIPKISGVVFVKGYFEETCTEALQQRVGRVAFAHLDADLYSSTICALRWLTPLLGTGSLLLFDEFIGERQSEARAFDEWRNETSTRLIRIAECDRDPSGWGSIPDRRVLFQVIGPEELPARFDKNSRIWKLAYYLGRAGFKEAEARILERL